MGRLIGTSGHVDHGKTSLIRALTGVDADRLPEEKSRGMTIDIGFAYLDLPEHGRVSIVDVPGHERFLSNMLVGAMGIDVALLCVAADAGVMPQTREHLQILELLPVQYLIVALTRVDLIESDFLELVMDEVNQLVNATRFAGAVCVPVSSLTGEGIDHLKREISSALHQTVQSREGPWYLPIDRVFTVKGHGTVVTGTLMRGVIREGSSAVVMPIGAKTRVRSIQSHEAPQEAIEFGHRTAVNLGGVEHDEVHRGMAVCEEGAMFASDCFDAAVRWVVEPKHGLRVRVSIGTDEVMGKVFLSQSQPEMAQFRLERPAAIALHQPFIVRRYSPPELLGGGSVVVPLAETRRRGDVVVVATGESDSDRLRDLIGQHPEGVDTDTICRLLGRTAQQLGTPFEELKASNEVLGFAGLWFTVDGFNHSVSRLHDALQVLHAQQPGKSGVPRERALAEAKLKWVGKPMDRIVSALAAENRIRVNGNEIAHPEFRVQLSARQDELLARVEAELASAGFAAPSPRELSQLLTVPPQAVDQILELGVQAGRLVRLAPDVIFLVAQIDELRDRARAFGRPFTAAEFRDAIGASRKIVIPLLEMFDAQRFTVRQGDQRTVIG